MKHPVIFLMGPTAAGKSAATLAVSRHWQTEIINVDSATIYRGMNIGTAKPSPAEQAMVPHHLLNILEPTQSYSAAQFREDALTAIRAIQGRGRLPILAGGTMLYFKALQEGLAQLPQADPQLRAELEARARLQGWPALHAELQAKDPVTAARLAPHDSQRIQRALEICMLSGQRYSDLLASSGPGADNNGVPANIADLHFIEISLEPSHRGMLHARIAERFDAMLEAGLVEEVRSLRARGDLSLDLPSMRCVGYRQIWSHLDGASTLTQAREQGIAATRQLAKRQLTWLRARPRRHIVDCLAQNAGDQIIALLREQLSRLSHA